jgi:hypothetical protein
MISIRCPRHSFGRQRKGSAIILSIVAIAILSMASLTLLRSFRRMNFRHSATIGHAQGQMIADGLIHRRIAFERLALTNPAILRDAGLKQFPRFEDAVVEPQPLPNSSIPRLAPTTLTIEVKLYPNAPSARTRMAVDVSPK